MVNNPDSIKSRSMAHRKVEKEKDTLNPLTGEEEPDGDGNMQQANGADIAKRMEFDKYVHQNLNDKQPLAMMDVVYSLWQGREEEADI